MGTVVTPDSALSVGVSSCQPEKISDKLTLSAWIGGVSEGVCRPPERRGGGVWRGYWHRSPWYIESYNFFCTARKRQVLLNFGIVPEARTVKNLWRQHMSNAITIVLTPTTSGATSGGAPHLFTLTLPDGVAGLCRRGGTGTTSRDWVAYGSKNTLPVSASDDFKAFLAWKAAQGK